jgi:hypothetical protein
MSNSTRKPNSTSVDHIVPLSKGGADDPSNWALMCRACNQAKGDAVLDRRSHRRLKARRCIGCGFVHAPYTMCPDGTKWRAADLECRVCGHRHVGVWPTSAVDDADLECSRCGEMACEPVGGDEV